MNGTRAVLAAGVLVALGLVVALLLWPSEEPPERPSSSDSVAPATPASSSPAAADPALTQQAALEALAEWDQDRSNAWAAGDVDALRALYVEGSRAGAQDVRWLQQWVDRGLVVTGMRRQVLAAEVLPAPGPDQIRLRVTDRVVGAVAVGPDGRRPLPADEASEFEITLAPADQGWVASAVRRTATTSSSRGG